MTGPNFKKANYRFHLLAPLVVWLCFLSDAQAQGPYLSDEESNPNTLGWMTGFPPAEDKIVGTDLMEVMSFPKIRWAFCHMREGQGSKRIFRGIQAPAAFEEAINPQIDEVRFTPIGGDKTMTWKESLSANYTDGIIVLHKGKLVYEYYNGCLTREGRHGAMSVTKSFIGLLAELLIADGTLDDSALVTRYVPELGDSAFGSATVRQVMDMTTGLKFTEDYADPNSDIWVYAAAGSPIPKPADYKGPKNFYEYLQTVKAEGAHDEAFAYKSINTDALAWIISRAADQSMIDLMSERIWKPLRNEQEADMLIDSIGTPLAAGGLNLSLRDAARFGQAMLGRGVIDGERVFPPSAVDSIANGGDPNKFASAGYTTLPGGSYRSMWWHLHNEHGAYSARGIHGQAIYVDPKADMVIARFATYPVSFNSKIDPTSLPAYHAVAKYLLASEAGSAGP
ncbi:MAG: serine hydrolase [Pseudomonadota bacterium]